MNPSYSVVVPTSLTERLGRNDTSAVTGPGFPGGAVGVVPVLAPLQRV